MAKDKAKKQEQGKQKGGKKSSRWSERTKQNKNRRAEIREIKLVRAAERRTRGATVVDPITGKKKKSATARDRREIQAGRVARKAEQRRNFSKLTPIQKEEHRALGRRQFV